MDPHAQLLVGRLLADRLARRTARFGVALDQIWRRPTADRPGVFDGLVISAIGDTPQGLVVAVVRGHYDDAMRPVDDFAGRGSMFAAHLVNMHILAVPAFTQVQASQPTPADACSFWCNFCDAVYAGPDGCDVPTVTAACAAHRRNCRDDRRPTIQ